MGKGLNKPLLLLMVVAFCLIMLSYSTIFSVWDLQNIMLWLWIFTIFLDWLHTRKLTYLQIWIIAYIYMIQSDIILTLYRNATNIWNVSASNYLSLANIFVVLGYLYASRIKGFKNISFSSSNANIHTRVVNKQKLFLILLILLTTIYLLNAISMVTHSLKFGRTIVKAAGSGSLISYLNGGLMLGLPALWAYYGKHVKKWSFLLTFTLVLPIILCAFFSGTRFKVLFAALPTFIIYNIIDINQFYGKKLLYFSIIGIIFIFLSMILKEQRNSGYNKMDFSFELIESEKVPLSVSMANNMSSETIVSLTAMSERYFNKNNHSLGIETLFILYFWIPRSQWPNKPYQLDYWLPRTEWHGLVKGYSSASGFTGELTADFGRIPTIIIVFFLGILLFNLDRKAHIAAKYSNYPFVLYGILFAAVFFFVRSPVTTIINLIGAILVYQVFLILCTHTSKNN